MRIEIVEPAVQRTWTDKVTAQQKSRMVQTGYLFCGDEMYPMAFELNAPENGGYKPGIYAFSTQSFRVERGRLEFSFGCPVVRTGDLPARKTNPAVGS